MAIDDLIDELQKQKQAGNGFCDLLILLPDQTTANVASVIFDEKSGVIITTD